MGGRINPCHLQKSGSPRQAVCTGQAGRADKMVSFITFPRQNDREADLDGNLATSGPLQTEPGLNRTQTKSTTIALRLRPS
eukprot:9705599-Alexandrium_andersonii.AAC.1